MAQRYNTFTSGRLIKALEKKWPKGFWRDGNAWDGRKAGSTVWAGAEDPDVKWKDGRPLFDYYVHDPREEHYELGVHKGFIQYLNDRGFWCEWNDPGTIFFYNT